MPGPRSGRAWPDRPGRERRRLQEPLGLLVGGEQPSTRSRRSGSPPARVVEVRGAALSRVKVDSRLEDPYRARRCGRAVHVPAPPSDSDRRMHRPGPRCDMGTRKNIFQRAARPSSSGQPGRRRPSTDRRSPGPRRGPSRFRLDHPAEEPQGDDRALCGSSAPSRASPRPARSAPFRRSRTRGRPARASPGGGRRRASAGSFAARLTRMRRMASAAAAKKWSRLSHPARAH